LIRIKKFEEGMFKAVLDYSFASLTSNSEKEEALAIESFARQMSLSDANSLQKLVDLSSQNRILLLLKELFEKSVPLLASSPTSSTNARRLEESIDSSLSESSELQTKRDTLVLRLNDLLSRMSLEHLFFKTFNPYGGVGVDVDLLIRKQDYTKFIKALLSDNFVPVDSLDKSYATGFLLNEERNPIIVDLHTDITILGVEYFSPETLFANKVKIPFQVKLEQERQEIINLCVPNDNTSAVIAMAHAIIKESSIKASDLLEVYKGLRSDPNDFKRLVKTEHLQLANGIFQAVLNFVLPVSHSLQLFNDNNYEASSFPSRFAMSLLLKSLEVEEPGCIRMPSKIPSQSSAIAFYETVRGRREIGQAIPKAISSFRFGRNLAIAGQKLTNPLRD
jgi:hypothetical protein